MEEYGSISSYWVERRRILNILCTRLKSESNTAHLQALPKVRAPVAPKHKVL